ncbi:DHHA1 domain-containing protein [uncultured Limosilactobacillus sp.]|uniref:DHHA1 domain-containing protein n=1 Tax=uncultured Limosilactobacillus sp. TaxID=2837629 RepID=UPI0025CCE054|nr:DHHA1 domain-containing protein [uncultured Limosilactobacillus sp.]
MTNRQIKIFSHNDLDGFGAPYLLQVVQATVFPDEQFTITNIGAGKIDEELDHWFTHADLGSFSDAYIMDMTPESEHTFRELNAHFANHWLVFDHHETAADIRQMYSNNMVTFENDQNQSATSLVWQWIQHQPRFKMLSLERQQQLAQVVELIRAYDTWDWQNDATLPAEVKTGADELDQLFWFYPLDHSTDFIQAVLQQGWPHYRQANQLLIQTLNDRRSHYLHHHLKDVLIDELAGHQWGFVYADDYKSEIAHELLQEHPEAEAAMVISPTSLSLRSNGQIDVAQFAEKYFHGGGHADAAGGRIDINLIQVGERAVIDHLQNQIQEARTEKAASQETVADNLDPAVAAKLATLFGDQK